MYGGFLRNVGCHSTLVPECSHDDRKGQPVKIAVNRTML